MPGGLLDMFGIDPVANRQSRQQMSMLEKQIAAELEKQKLANSGQLESTRESGNQQRLTEGTRGEESRKTATAQAELEKALETIKNSNLLGQKEKEQTLAIMTQAGVMSAPSTKNEKRLDSATAGPRIAGAAAMQRRQNRITATPEYGQSLAAGMNAANLAPGFDNMAKARMSASPGEIAAMPPSGFAQPPSNMNNWNVMQGATSSEQIVPAPFAPGTQIPMGDPTVVRQQQPGRIRTPVDPALMQQAMQMGDGAMTNPAVGPSPITNPMAAASQGQPVAPRPNMAAMLGVPSLQQPKQPMTIEAAIRALMEAQKQKNTGISPMPAINPFAASQSPRTY